MNAVSLSKVQLGATAVKLTRLGFGTSKLFRLHSTRERQRLLETAFDHGIHHFDTARSYGLGRAEEELGRFCRGRRQCVTIGTKYGIPISRAGRMLRPVQTLLRRAIGVFPVARTFLSSNPSPVLGPRNFSRAEADASLTASLNAIKSDYVDLFFLHEPTLTAIPDDGLTEWLAAQRQKGRIRAWGLSGPLSESLLVAKSRPQLACVIQYQLDAIRRLTDPPPPDNARIAYRPFAETLPQLLKAVSAGGEATHVWKKAVGIPTDAESLAQFLLVDALASPHNGLVVFTTTRCDRIASLAAAADVVPDMQQIAGFRSWIARFLNVQKPLKA